MTGTRSCEALMSFEKDEAEITEDNTNRNMIKYINNYTIFIEM